MRHLLRSRRSRFNEIGGRHVGTRTPDLYRVKFEVNVSKPFPHLAFPQFKDLKTTRKKPSFDGELMASSWAVPDPSPESVVTCEMAIAAAMGCLLSFERTGGQPRVRCLRCLASALALSNHFNQLSA